MELNGAGFCPGDLIDGVGHILLRDKCLIGCVKEDHGPGFIGVIHPLLKGGPIQRGAGGVIGRAQIDHVHGNLGQLRQEAVFRSGGHVVDV